MPEIEVDEVFRLCVSSIQYAELECTYISHTMCDEAAKISANDTMPGSTLSRVELALSVRQSIMMPDNIVPLS